MLRSLGVRLSGGLLGIAVLFGMAAGTMGCGKFFPPLNQCTTDCTTSTNFMYVANSAVTSTVPASLAGFSLTTNTTAATSTTPATSTLALAITPGSAYATTFVPIALALTPSNNYMYVASASGGIYLYGINSSTGQLTEENNSAVVASDLAASMQVDKTGAWLIVADQTLVATSKAVINIYSINSSTGLLTLSQSLQNGVKTAGISNQLYLAPNNVNLFLTLTAGGTETMTFNASTGALTDQGTLPLLTAQNQAQGVTTDPNSKYAFVTETGATTGVRVLVIGTNGALSEATGSPFATGTGPTAVLVDSSGSYVYVANKTSNSISAYVLAANGTLTQITGSPFATGTTPVGLAEDASKTYLGVVCNGGGYDLEVYSFDATTLGALDAAGHGTTGTDPTQAVAIVATK